MLHTRAKEGQREREGEGGRERATGPKLLEASEAKSELGRMATLLFSHKGRNGRSDIHSVSQPIAAGHTAITITLAITTARSRQSSRSSVKRNLRGVKTVEGR